MKEDKYFFNNCWWINHPTINFFTFETEVVTIFGYKCILEKYQDGVCCDDEYWGSVLYDFNNDRYIYFSTYVNENEIEEILNKWLKINPDIWVGKISEDFVNDKGIVATDKTKWAVDFYKSYIASNTDLDFEDYYKNIFNN